MRSLATTSAPTRITRPFWERTGVAGKIDLRIASTLETLDACLAAGEAGRHDSAFIDADKTGYDAYYERCLQLLRPGGLAMLDNTLRGGAVVRPANGEDTQAIQALNIKIHADQRVDMVLLPFSDGITTVRKR